MVDIKQVKAALLREFNGREPAAETLARDEPLDTALSQYFNGAAHMPRALLLEAIANLLRLDKPARDVTPQKVEGVLARFET